MHLHSPGKGKLSLLGTVFCYVFKPEAEMAVEAWV